MIFFSPSISVVSGWLHSPNLASIRINILPSGLYAIALPVGVGLSHITKKLLEECLAPDGHPHLACDGPFVGMSAQHVERHAADHSEIARGMVLSRAGVIFVEDHVEVQCRWLSIPQWRRVIDIIRQAGSRLDMTT